MPDLYQKQIKSTEITSSSVQAAGTVEHLAARRPLPLLDANAPDIKQLLINLRAEWTRLVTGLRWEGIPVQETALRMIPLLNVGPVEQWKDIFIPLFYEIDRSGVLIPAWLHIIERGDPPHLAPDANPAETKEGRARRFALLMLGNYKLMGISGLDKKSGFAKAARNGSMRSERAVAEILGDLALDPSSSLYATQSLVKHGTVQALEALIGALRYAKGWAKVDVVTACLAWKQAQLNDLLIAAGLYEVAGLESYLAIPIYRAIPLEPYLSGRNQRDLRFLEQSALILSQILRESIHSLPIVGAAQDPNDPPASAERSRDPRSAVREQLPTVFERPLLPLAQALLAGAQDHPLWQQAVAIHHLGYFLGHYWSEISQGTIKDGRIIEQINQCLPLVQTLESWMHSIGRNTLLNMLANADTPPKLAYLAQESLLAQ